MASGGRLRRIPVLALAAVAAASTLWAADPVVSNVRARQLPGSGQVEVLYDLSGAPAQGATVSVVFSADGGGTFGIVPGGGTLSGQVGAGVRNEINRQLVWDAAATLGAGAYGVAYRARVTATGGQGQSVGAYWRFDEGSGTVANDSMNENNGVVSGAFWTAGYQGSGLQFSRGTNSAVNIPRSAFDGFGNTAYVEAWVYPTALPTLAGTVFRKRGAYNDWDLSQLPDGRVVTTVWGYVGTGGTNGWQAVGVVSPDALPLNTWSKLSSWYDGNTITLSINGVSVASDTKALPLVWDTPLCPGDTYYTNGCYYGTWIGSTSTYSRTFVDGRYTFSGTIDEVRIATSPIGG